MRKMRTTERTDRRKAIARGVSLTALAVAALTPGTAWATDYAFIGGTTMAPGYGAHYPDGCECGNSVGDTYNYNLAGNLFDPNAYTIGGGSSLPAPGPNDTISAFGDVQGDNPPVMGPPGTFTIDAGLITVPVYGQIGPGFNGTGLSASGSGTVAALAIGGNGSLTGSTITATNSIEILNGGPAAKYTQVYRGPSVFVGYAPTSFTVSGSKLDGGPLMYLENGSSDPNYVSALTIDNSMLTADTVNLYEPGTGQIVFSGQSALLAGTTNLYVDNPIQASPSALGITDVVFRSGSGIGTDALNIGVTRSGNPPADASSALLEIDNGAVGVTGITIVGVQAPGGIDVYNNGELGTEGNTFLGIFAAATGSEIDVHDGGTWHSNGQILIGGNTDSTVSVTDTGTLVSDDLIAVGLNANSTGTLDIEDGGSVTSDAKAGPGTLSGTVGANTGSTGMVEIDGDGSVWENKQSLSIGTSGNGAVDVADGGMLKVDGLQLRVGRNEGSIGVLQVSGQGSTVDVSQGTIYVGNGGTGEADFSDGGSITAMATSIGELETGVGILTFDGTGGDSDLGDTIVGNAGGGNLELSNGATVTVGKLTAAAQEGSLALIELDGSGTTLTIDDDASIGKADEADFALTGGARVNANKVTLGEEGTGVGTISVEDAGSLLDARDDLTVGGEGQGTLTIASGGRVTADAKLVVGEAAGSEGVVEISGQDSALTVHDDTEIGKGGSGMLTLDDNAMFTGDTVKVGSDAGGEGSVSVGGGATLQTGDLTIGGNGTGTLDIADGQVITGGEGKIGDGEDGEDGTPGGGGTGEVTLSDPQALWQNDALTVGGNGTGTLTVTAGAVATGGDATIGDEDGSTGTVDLDGDEARWTVAGGLTVGGKGMGTLTIENGATLGIAGSDFTIGDEASGMGLVTLDGQGSTIQFASGIGSGEIKVGGGGTGVLALQDGAQLSTSKVTVGDEATGNGTLNLLGDNTLLQVNQDFTLGGGGHGTLSVRQNAILRVNGDFNISDEVTGGGVATLDMGGQLAVGGGLSIGAKAQGSLTVMGGSLVSALGDSVELGENVGGAGVLVVTGGATAQNSNMASTFVAAGDVKVGDGGAGEIDIEDGAVFKPTPQGNGMVEIGVQSTAIGTVSVDGTGSSFAASTVAVGGAMDTAGGTGRLLVTGGGAVAIAKTLNLWAGGTVSVDVASQLVVGQAAGVAGAVAVGSGGTLEGTGTIVGNVDNVGGIVHPGHSPGTLTIAGNYTQGANGTLLLSIGPASYGQLVVNGTATLNGGTIVLQDYQGGKISLGQSYQFINASGGVSGQVASVQSDDPFVALTPSIAGGVLMLTAAHAPNSFAAAATTGNQRAVAAALDATSSSRALVPLVQALTNLPTARMSDAFDALSGEGLVAVENAAFDAARAFDRSVAGHAAVPGSAADSGAVAQHLGAWQVWIEGLGDQARFASRDGQALASARTSDSGFSAGTDYRAADSLIVGIATGWSKARYSVPGRATSGSVDNVHLAGYAAFSAGAFYANALGGYDWADTHSRRALAVGTTSGTLRGTASDGLLSGRIEAGYRLALGRASVTPFAAIEAMRFHLESSGEGGDAAAVGAALQTPSQHVRSVPVTAGVKLETRFDLGSMVVVPHLVAGYERELDDRRALTFDFAGQPAVPFTIDGVAPGRDRAHVGLGVTALLSKGMRLFVDASTDRAAHDHLNAVHGGIAWTW
jgi:T5SS/PEP-CTERM-associated repeat protein